MGNPVVDQKEYTIFCLDSITREIISECIFATASKYQYNYSADTLSSADDTFISIYLDDIEISIDSFSKETIASFMHAWGAMPRSVLPIECSSGSGVSSLAIHFAETLQARYPQTCFNATSKVVFFDHELQNMEAVAV